MTSRLLLVEQSTTMRYVLENHVKSLGFDVVELGDYAEAEAALYQQFSVYGSDYAGVILGWSIAPDPAAESLVELLDSPDFQDLPVVVMSTDMRASTRAWVAGREHTAVLAWKHYQGIDSLLQRLVNDATADTSQEIAKFDNQDIHILIVDDSPTIRLSLRDLFKLQGYSVTLAGSHNEALSAMRNGSFDIALLDYYLQDSTGDELCRELVNDPANGHLICAVLTGTYADHIIKRSLRAGAVECMFKNESHELLLSRIDAISRFVRQRKRLGREQKRLDHLVDALAGATLLIDRNNVISYASELAARTLSFAHSGDLQGQQADLVIDMAAMGAAIDEQNQLHTAFVQHAGTWLDQSGAAIDVVYQQAWLSGSEELVVNFRRASDDSTSALGILAPVDESVREPLPLSAKPWLACLQAYLAEMDELSDLVSVLVLQVFANRNDQLLQIQDVEGLMDTVESTLTSVYKRDNHVAAIGGSRFAFLLRHTSEPQAYLLTRKIMQICNDIEAEGKSIKISCTGCLSSLAQNADLVAIDVLDQAQQGLEIVNMRGQNQALLLDLQRMLPTYPAEAGPAD